MRRHTFGLSWGRKIFFGFVWPVLTLIAFNYLQSRILPQSTSGWIYYLTTLVGHFGLLTSILYFIFYVPVVWLMPSYYVARFWSLILTLIGALYILFDSIVFNQYRYHLNGFILDLLLAGKSEALNFPMITYSMLAVGVLVFSLIFWLRGERIWRVMQGRFSNPNGNWYLVLIGACLITSHSMHMYGKAAGTRAVTSLAQLFPMHFPASANKFLEGKVEVSEAPNRVDDFHYPKKAMECNGEDDKNILMIVVDGLNEAPIDFFVTPKISHLVKHGTSLENHYSGSTSTEGSLFSLFYSLPSNYWDAARGTNKAPVLLSEMTSKNYDFGVFSSAVDKAIFSNLPAIQPVSDVDPKARDKKIAEGWKAWLKVHQEEKKESPFFGFLFFDSANIQTDVADDHKLALNEVDDLIGDVLHDLYLKKLNDETVIIVTGAHGVSSASKVPMIVIWPEKRAQRIERLTSHYDVVPTLMHELWNCKNKNEDYSYGQNFFKSEQKDWLLVSHDSKYDILDFNSKLITQIDPMGSYSVKTFSSENRPKDEAREDLVFNVLKDLNRFMKK